MARRTTKTKTLPDAGSEPPSVATAEKTTSAQETAAETDASEALPVPVEAETVVVTDDATVSTAETADGVDRDADSPETAVEDVTPDKADSEAETDGLPDKPSQAIDLFDYSQTVVTITYTYLPDDGHPEGRPVLVGLRTRGQDPLFSEPLREHSDALSAAVSALQETYQLSLPSLKAQADIKAAAVAADAVLKQGSKTTLKPKAPPTELAQPLEQTNETGATERKLSLFGT